MDPVIQPGVEILAGGAIEVADRRLTNPQIPVPVAVTGTGESNLAEMKPQETAKEGDCSSPATFVDRARSGDPEAFHAIFLRYGKPVASFLYHFVGDRAHAEELAQETFFRAFRGLDRMQEGVKLSTWLFGIARNVAREAIRDRHRNRREIGLDEGLYMTLSDERANPDEDFMSAELQRLIRRSIIALSEDQRIVFVLKVFNRMRYQEISRITGSSTGKLKTDLHRARERMRQMLQPYLEGRVPGM